MIERDDSTQDLVYQIAIILESIERQLQRIADHVDPNGMVGSSDEGD